MKIKELLTVIENKYPLSLAYDWDNCGLMVGDKEAEIKNVLVTIEANNKIIQEAIDRKADLIITHHPFLFKKINSVTTNDYKGKLIYQLIKNDIGIYSMHTNFDIAKDGLNDYFLEKLSLTSEKILDVTQKEAMYKIVVYVPKAQEETVRKALADAKAGAYENYTECTYHLDGTGHFKPEDGANPFIGSVGTLETVDEVRIETTVCESYLNGAVKAMLKVHPYETPAYDIIRLTNTGQCNGLGRVASLPFQMTLGELAKKIKEVLSMPAIRIVGDRDTLLSKAAVVTGSGAEFVKAAKRHGADVLITGDLKYHEAQDAVDSNMCVIDCNHFESEAIFKEVMARFLRKIDGINVMESEVNINPFTIL